MFILNMFDSDSEEGEYAMSSDFAEASESEEEGHRITTPRPVDGFFWSWSNSINDNSV